MLYLIAIFTARAFIYGINPFIISLLLASMLTGVSDIMLCFSLLLGLASYCIPAGDYVPAVKYGVMLIAAVFLYNVFDGRRKKYRIWSVLFAVCVIDVTVALLAPGSISIPDGLAKGGMTFAAYGLLIMAEAVLFGAMLPIYERALLVLVKREEDVRTFNEEMISVLFVCGIIIWGIPVDLGGIINTLLLVCMYGIIYVAYRFGSGYGMAFAGVAGMVMAIRESSPEYVGAAFVMAICSLTGRLFKRNKKLCAITGFIMGYALAGALYFDELYTLRAIKAATAAVALFALTPRAWITARDDRAYNGHSAETAREVTRITAGRIRELAGAFKRIEYTLAGCGNENVRINLGEIGSLIGRFSDNLEQVEPVKNNKEELLRERFMDSGIEMTHMTAVRDEGNHKKYYITARSISRKIMLSKDAARLISEIMNENIRVAEDTSAIISETSRVIVFEESCSYRCQYEVKRIKKYGSLVSGDNFSVKENADGRLVMMISDGMGSGSLASCESGLMVDTMEELMETGFDPLYAIAFSNECITARNEGSSFTTFDMGVIDLYDGTLELYKQGAAPTYIVRAGDTVEEIRSTTLPVGVLDAVECDRSYHELSDGDVVIMVSDGVFSGALVDLDGYIKELLHDLPMMDCRDIMEELMTGLLKMSNGCFDDDVTVIVSCIRKEKN